MMLPCIDGKNVVRSRIVGYVEEHVWIVVDVIRLIMVVVDDLLFEFVGYGVSISRLLECQNPIPYNRDNPNSDHQARGHGS
jgi:hypothetical protein